MNKKIELPIIEPLCGAYHNIGGGFCIIKDNPSIINWYLNEAVSLICNRKFLEGYTTPQLHIRLATCYENECLDKIPINAKYINGCANRIIRNLLDDGYYVYFRAVDDYYIEGKSWYGTRHFEHDGLITGYDQENKTFTIFAYDINWRYRQFKISQKSFEKARKKMYPNATNFRWFGLKPKKDEVMLEPKKVLQRLRDHLNSSFEKYPLDGKGNVYGIIAHDYIALYLDKILDGSIPYERIDWRIFRSFWDHKKLMYMRLKSVEKNLNLTDDISSKYESVLNKSNDLRMWYAAYCKKRRDSVLVSIRDELLKIGKQEETLLTAFVEKMQTVLESKGG